MTERIAAGHEPRWDLDLSFGKQGELLVLNVIQSIANGTCQCEVKRDRQFQKTGRLYIELEQNPGNRGIWVPSGLAKSRAPAWAFLCNNDQGLFLVDTPWLKRAVELAAQFKANHAAERDGDNPTRGVCITLTHLQATRQP